MHKIYEDNGEFNFIYQLPSMLFSSIIPGIINMLLRHLSLSERNILKIKKENNMKTIMTISKNIKKCLIIKFVAFFTLNFILLFFCWYFITCFCAVYYNTQMILIKDTLISFSFSLTYSFILYLIPGFFRISSLRTKNKDKECYYRTRYMISLL